MYEFSLRRAWSYGFGFFSGRFWAHAALLVGVGILIPSALQFLLLGQTVGMMRPPANAAGDLQSAEFGGAVGALILLGYTIQLGSFIASLRLGLARDATLGRAAMFGFGAAILVMVAVLIAMLALGALFAAIAPVVAAIVVGALILAALAVFVPVLAALWSVAIALLLVLAMVVGASMGEVGYAATLAGGSGGVAVLAVLAAVLLLWLTARLCCTTALMADRKTVNLFSAMAASWRLTWEEQFRVMGYVALVGLVLSVLLFGAAVALGAGLEAWAPDSEPELGPGADLLALTFNLPIAFLSVMVPAGIYRELAGSSLSVDVFA